MFNKDYGSALVFALTAFVTALPAAQANSGISDKPIQKMTNLELTTEFLGTLAASYLVCSTEQKYLIKSQLVEGLPFVGFLQEPLVAKKFAGPELEEARNELVNQNILMHDGTTKIECKLAGGFLFKFAADVVETCESFSNLINVIAGKTVTQYAPIESWPQTRLIENILDRKKGSCLEISKATKNAFNEMSSRVKGKYARATSSAQTNRTVSSSLGAPSRSSTAMDTVPSAKTPSKNLSVK